MLPTSSRLDSDVDEQVILRRIKFIGAEESFGSHVTPPGQTYGCFGGLEVCSGMQMDGKGSANRL